ncbi:hypothetical protein ROLI_032750 [Roseobacter fucihabitans]|uniref:Lipoprotein n=1 Tax=Roseobacter fucihabitans TaxID=1537242 RepID=A0ABZ2BVY2_9RHOB|nr:hypothetical protein [Roseobacter litoralis]MBC6964601.1 hypothetical protein [Roseobacter litoralis]
MQTLRALPVIAVLAGCDQTSEPTVTTLPLFGEGYRFDGDICRRVGEDAFTNPFLDDAAVLVACPTGAANTGGLITTAGAREVARRDGYTLYSIPTR